MGEDTTANVDAEMAELLKSSLQLDIDTRTFLIVSMAGYTAALLLVWVFTGSHVAMIGFLAFAMWNIREVSRVNDLQDRLSQCDFTEALSFAAHHIIRWSMAVTTHAERRAALSPSQGNG